MFNSLQLHAGECLSVQRSRTETLKSCWVSVLLTVIPWCALLNINKAPGCPPIGSERALLFRGPVYKGPDRFLHKQNLARFHLAFTRDWRNWTNPNDRNISMQHIATLLSGACCLRFATLFNATCCDFLSIKNRTNAHTRVQHCCMNLAKRPQHHATSTDVT